MIGPALLLLPVLGILVFDPLPPDAFAVKTAVLMIGAALCLVGAIAAFISARDAYADERPWRR